MISLEIMNLPLNRDHCLGQCYDAQTSLKLIRLLQLLGNEAKLEQGRLPSEETGCVYEGPLDEDATNVLPTESRDVERGIAVVDGMVIIIT